MNGPVPYLKGKWSECHRVRNAKRPREGSNSRTVSNYYIDYQFRQLQAFRLSLGLRSRHELNQLVDAHANQSISQWCRNREGDSRPLRKRLWRQNTCLSLHPSCTRNDTCDTWRYLKSKYNNCNRTIANLFHPPSGQNDLKKLPAESYSLDKLRLVSNTFKYYFMIVKWIIL